MKQKLMFILDVNETEYQQVLELAAYAGAVIVGLVIGTILYY